MKIAVTAVCPFLFFLLCAGCFAAEQTQDAPQTQSPGTDKAPAALAAPPSPPETAVKTNTAATPEAQQPEVSKDAGPVAKETPATQTSPLPNGQENASTETPTARPDATVEGSAAPRQIGRSRKRGYSGAYYTTSKAGSVLGTSTYSTPLYTPMTYAADYRPSTYFYPTTYYRSDAYYTPASSKGSSEEFAVSRPYYTTTRTSYYSRPTTTYYSRPLEYATYYSRPLEYETYSKGESYDFGTTEYYYRPSTTYTYARPATTYYRSTVDTFSKDSDFAEDYSTEFAPTTTYYRGPSTITTYSDYRPLERYRTYAADSKGSAIEEYEPLYSSSYYPTTYYSRPSTYATFARPATTVYRTKPKRYRYLQNRQMPRKPAETEKGDEKAGEKTAEATANGPAEVTGIDGNGDQELGEQASAGEKEDLRALQEAEEDLGSSDSTTE